MTNERGVTALIDHIHMRQYIYTVPNLEDNWNTGELWLEAGHFIMLFILSVVM